MCHSKQNCLSAYWPGPACLGVWLRMRFTWHDDSLGRVSVRLTFNTLRPRQNGRHFADDTFKPIFLNENIRISIKISLKFVLKGPINNIPALVQIMAWHQSGYKPLSEPMMVNLLTHISVTRPQWVNLISPQTNMVMTSHFIHLPRDKMVTILKTVFSHTLSLMTSFVSWLQNHWSLFLRVQLTITQHWFR